MRMLEVPEDKVNVNGGAIALGHPQPEGERHQLQEDERGAERIQRCDECGERLVAQQR